ncbi:hypothetical protein WNY78_17685 [Psychroserpens sp. AS72]|uniref:hypothetical protein n=1 Tax=Psychroserpens sp. AS72 TaxID=3135775 RepID=UPI003174A8C9
MKTISQFKTLITLVLCISLFTCSNNDDEQQSNEYPISYAEFTIQGPNTNGNYEYRDEVETDDFSTTGRLYTTQENPDLPEDQIQLYIGKTFSLNNFLVVAPNSTGTHSITYQGGPNDRDVAIKLTSPEENYYAKEVSITITELELNGSNVIHCKGTFAGSFYRYNLVEADVHTINGEFEINQ